MIIISISYVFVVGGFLTRDQNSYLAAHRALLALKNRDKAIILGRFFKTAKGEYGYGDRFLGVMVPSIRQLSRRFEELRLAEVQPLMRSQYNEERLLGLLILGRRFAIGGDGERTKIKALYMRNLRYVNNWNLVDLSAPYILGPYLLGRSSAPLYRLARSENIWMRRVAVLSTLSFIRAGRFDDTLKLAELLLADEHHLMHKACGWMLREVGKRDPLVLETFLQKHLRNMPRTMLRYAIERFPEAKRRRYLSGRG